MKIGRDGRQKIVIAGAPTRGEELVQTGETAGIPADTDSGADTAIHIRDGCGVASGNLWVNILGDPHVRIAFFCHDLKRGKDEPIAVIL